jgi:hypothetical protein
LPKWDLQKWNQKAEQNADVSKEDALLEPKTIAIDEMVLPAKGRNANHASKRMHIKLHQHGPTEGISDTGAYVYF